MRTDRHMMGFIAEAIYLLKRTLFKSLALVAVLVVAGFLLAQLSALLHHPSLTDYLWLDQVPVEIYLEPNSPELEALLARIDTVPELDLMEILSADDAAQSFNEDFGLEVEELLGENPFPLTLRCKLTAGSNRLDAPRIVENLTKGRADYFVDVELFEGIGQRARGLLIALCLGIGLAFLLLLVMLRLGTKAERSAYRLERALLKESGATSWQTMLPEMIWQLALTTIAWLCVLGLWNFEQGILSSLALDLELPFLYWILFPACSLLAFQAGRSRKD
jgi:cell division protein FtsX